MTLILMDSQLPNHVLIMLLKIVGEKSFSGMVTSKLATIAMMM
jgi:hypothetical protein